MMENLDLKCARFGQKLAEIAGLEEKHLTDALFVLEEQGLYAFFLFLGARLKGSEGENKKNHLGQEIQKKCLDFLKEFKLVDDGPDVFQALQKICEDLPTLLFARDLLCQTLVYARFHLKAKEGAK